MPLVREHAMRCSYSQANYNLRVFDDSHNDDGGAYRVPDAERGCVYSGT